MRSGRMRRAGARIHPTQREARSSHLNASMTVVSQQDRTPARGRRSLSVPRWITDHGLSLSFGALFLAAAIGQSVTGHISYNEELSMHGLRGVGYVRYLGTGNFVDAMLTNWQAAILQLGCLIVFGAKFRERGAAHSLRPVRKGDKRRKPDGAGRPWVYRHSLSLAFGAIFVLCFLGHLLFGSMDYNTQLRMVHRPPVSVASYGRSAAFWFSNTQTWEAEFAAIVIYVLLSIYLRQQGSPESKPVDSSNATTGETNH